MEKESKQPKLGTPEAKRELDALHKLMRRYTAGGDLTVEELHLLDKVAVSDERTSPGKEPETKNAGRRILRRVYAATVPHDGDRPPPSGKSVLFRGSTVTAPSPHFCCLSASVR